ncbi:MAG: 50S ribosomal protein L9 [Actinomycetes bacterium]|jgi:large subunit ribosomal protein L9|nr:MAG: 50S ribosomal protein L9 [Actinomycetota bacterium]
MKLILTKDVPSLGKKGDVVEVAKGYARNYLLPKKFAIEANPGALEAAEKIRQARVEAEEKARRAAEGVAQQLAGTRVVIAAHAGDEGQLYGSVSVSDVIEGINRFTGVELERNQVVVEKPIKEIGLHEVIIKLHPEVEFPITLDVIPA